MIRYRIVLDSWGWSFCFQSCDADNCYCLPGSD
jgi:hypothetical protein